MTDVAFHFNAPDPLAYASRLLRKAVSAGARLVVTGSQETLGQISAQLWALSPVEFVPHCQCDSHARVVAVSPVVLAPLIGSTPHLQVLVNLGSAVPEGFEQFERLIEIVGPDEADRQEARSRWKRYASLGHGVTGHDLAPKTSNP